MADEPTWDDLFGNSTAELPRRTGSPHPHQHQHQHPHSHSHSAQSDAPHWAQEQPSGAPLSRSDVLHAERANAPGSPHRSRPPRRKRSLKWLWVLIVLLGFGSVGAAVVWTAFGPQIRHVMGWEAPIDYTGNGNGQAATITIVQGQVGSDIAKSLRDAGVTKTATAFYDLLLKTPVTFEPGTYKLQKQMSAKAALAELKDPKNRVISRVVIPEGTTLAQYFVRLSKGTGVPVTDFQAAAKDRVALGVPKAAPSLEGFLFPATYEFDPGLSAKAILQRLVKRMDTALDGAGVPKSERLHVLTLASIIQKEGGSAKDFYKVARVFQNRLDKKMLLQSDATVSYGAGSKTISTTAAQRADAKNKYNTYVHVGLPVGPIAAPGDAAIKAALHPAKGPWLYFVLVNGYTGKTAFSTTLAQHNAAVLQWQAWSRAHPDFGK